MNHMKISSAVRQPLLAILFLLFAGLSALASDKDTTFVTSPKIRGVLVTNPVSTFEYEADTFKQYYDYYWLKNTKKGAYFYTVAYYHDGRWIREDYSIRSKKICRYFTFSDKKLCIKDGPAFVFNENGDPQTTGYFVNNQRDGSWIYYNEAGDRTEVTQYLQGMPVGICYNYYPGGVVRAVDSFDETGTGTGTYTSYYEDGRLKQRGKYATGGRYDSTWVYHYPDGTTFFLETFDKGRVGAVACFGPDQIASDTCVVFQAPMFPGGEKKLTKYLYRNIFFPLNKGFKDQHHARILVNFWIDEKGNVSDIKFEQTIGIGFDDQVLRAMKKMPAWQPAIAYNRPVGSRYWLPLNFFDPTLERD